MKSRRRLLILGASVRAAAFSALRAGFDPICADLFADLDLKRHCETIKLTGTYPGCLRRAFVDDSVDPWIYTGGLENEPALIDELAQRRPLWGNDGQVLRKVRRPEFLAECATATNLPVPDIARTLPMDDERWLLKPFAGAGGLRIHEWDPTEKVVPDGFYLQQHIDGDSLAGLYIALPNRVELLGVTKQLIGVPWLHAGGYRYCGSLGPVTVKPEVREQFQSLGETIGRRSAIRGLFGVDVILRDSQIYPLEINPRYTASMELLEYALGVRLLDAHRTAFESDVSHSALKSDSDYVYGKTIVFTPREYVVAPDAPWFERMSDDIHTMPTYADIPHPGERIEAGRPVVTVFAQGRTESECVHELQRLARAILIL